MRNSVDDLAEVFKSLVNFLEVITLDLIHGLLDKLLKGVIISHALLNFFHIIVSNNSVDVASNSFGSFILG